ncbi:MAG: MGMT family protein [Opitutus sp.]|nr:MGMT family protein [Opitutus sp.]
MPRLVFPTLLGSCALSWHEHGLTRFELPEAGPQPDDVSAAPERIEQLIARVREHLGGRFQDFSDVCFDFKTVPEFNAEVLRATLQVKSGTTRTYGEIARLIGRGPVASRAVGAALGANPWPLLIPCHRIVAADGRMTGFSGPGGIRTKLRLLALEGAELFAD